MSTTTNGHFILDVSVLTKGFGNIKKWVESNDYNVKLFIPLYTIHELDYLKNGTSIIAINARKSSRFIEKIICNSDSNLQSKIIVENPEESLPSWKTCVKYKTRSPKVVDFHVPKSKPSVIQYESEVNLYDDDNNDSDSDSDAHTRAIMPHRLKELIKPCVQKTKFDPENWKLITEDSSIKIWCESYGIKCINITKAESEMFQKKLSVDIINESIEPNHHIHSKRGGRGKGRGRGGKRNSVEEHQEPPIQNGDGVVVEKFKSISYAPRGHGDLWVP